MASAQRPERKKIVDLPGRGLGAAGEAANGLGRLYRL